MSGIKLNFQHKTKVIRGIFCATEKKEKTTGWNTEETLATSTASLRDQYDIGRYSMGDKKQPLLLISDGTKP